MHLYPRLESESTYVIDLPLSQVRLSHNAAFPWIILVPQKDGLVELIDLTSEDQQKLMQEIATASQIMRQLFHPTKLNVANLGNRVPQLHIHVIARYENDAAWPGPVWGEMSETYDPALKLERIKMLKEAFQNRPIPSSSSPLRQAYDLSLEAAQEGFDWEFPVQAVLKVQEETEEVLAELKKPDSLVRQEALLEEMGDLFLACTCLARHCNVNPEEAILVGIQKFIKRYERLKSFAKEQGVSLQNAPRAELSALWQKLKKESQD
ncbi:MAG: HIT domain-containing protein [Proteobacteria bacterium]|nr:HIT domain-containing protein [Pseudomonadota bacterium]